MLRLSGWFLGWVLSKSRCEIVNGEASFSKELAINWLAIKGLEIAKFSDTEMVALLESTLI